MEGRKGRIWTLGSGFGPSDPEPAFSSFYFGPFWRVPWPHVAFGHRTSKRLSACGDPNGYTPPLMPWKWALPMGCPVGVPGQGLWPKWADLGLLNPLFRPSRPLVTLSGHLVSKTRLFLILFWTLLAGFRVEVVFRYMASKRQSACISGFRHIPSGAV